MGANCKVCAVRMKSAQCVRREMKKLTFSLRPTAVIKFKEYYFVRQHSSLVKPTVSRAVVQLVSFITRVRKYTISWNQVFLPNRSEVIKSQWAILIWFSDWTPYAMAFRVSVSGHRDPIHTIYCGRRNHQGGISHPIWLAGFAAFAQALITLGSPRPPGAAWERPEQRRGS